jgi:hypothetical protein
MQLAGKRLRIRLQPGLKALLAKVEEVLAAVRTIVDPHRKLIGSHNAKPMRVDELATQSMRAEERQQLAADARADDELKALIMNCKLGVRELFLEKGPASFLRLHTFFDAPNTEEYAALRDLRLLYYYGTIQVRFWLAPP